MYMFGVAPDNSKHLSGRCNENIAGVRPGLLNQA